jgi:hypothetical protein
MHPDGVRVGALEFAVHSDDSLHPVLFSWQIGHVGHFRAEVVPSTTMGFPGNTTEKSRPNISAPARAICTRGSRSYCAREDDERAATG